MIRQECGWSEGLASVFLLDDSFAVCDKLPYQMRRERHSDAPVLSGLSIVDYDRSAYLLGARLDWQRKQTSTVPRKTSTSLAVNRPGIDE